MYMWADDRDRRMSKIAGQEHPDRHRPTEGMKQWMAPAVIHSKINSFTPDFIICDDVEKKSICPLASQDAYQVCLVRLCGLVYGFCECSKARRGLRWVVRVFPTHACLRHWVDSQAYSAAAACVLLTDCTLQYAHAPHVGLSLAR